jgi:hypothetical protein
MMHSRINFAYLYRGSLFLISFTRWKKSKTGRMQFTTLLLIPYLEPVNILPIERTKKDVKIEVFNKDGNGNTRGAFIAFYVNG